MIRLGQRLSGARLAKRITLEEAAKSLRIRIEFLQALEKGEYDKLPSSAYAVGFVGNYATFLGLPKEETVKMFRREFEGKSDYTILPEGFTKQKEFSTQRFHIRQIGFLGILVICVIGYILFQYRFVILSPSLELSTPKDNGVFQTSEITISGKSDPNATVYVNTAPVSLQQDGSFSKELELFEGDSIVRVEAINRFGKKTIIERHISVELPHSN